MARRAIVYAGQPAIHEVVVSDDKIQSISMTFMFVTPAAATDPMAAGQTLTPDPEEAARDFRNVLDAQFSLHGFASTPTAETVVEATQVLFCSQGKGRLLNTLGSSEARVQLVVSEPATGGIGGSHLYFAKYEQRLPLSGSFQAPFVVDWCCVVQLAAFRGIRLGRFSDWSGLRRCDWHRRV